MARLHVTSEGFEGQLIELKLGINRLGRHPANDFEIDHPTVSSRHCEIILSQDEVRVRDCSSTNGTFVDGQVVWDSPLTPGQTLRLGDVELLVESTEFNIAIPRFELPRPAPPVVLSDGSLICPRHKERRARYQCTHCHEVMCEGCIHRLRRRGGKMLDLCPLCGQHCELMGSEHPKKKRPLFAFLQRTIKLAFFRVAAGHAERS